MADLFESLMFILENNFSSATLQEVLRKVCQEEVGRPMNTMLPVHFK